MQPFVFCSRCRGLRPGWNQGYILHWLLCDGWFSHCLKLVVLASFIAVLIVVVPSPIAPGFSSSAPDSPMGRVTPESAPAADPAVHVIDAFLERHRVDDSLRSRVAEAVVRSAKTYDLDARLIASIIIVESGANPFAVSGSDSVGIMQIHLGTWGPIAVREGVNLFKVEDNIAFGARILRDYVRQFGLWDGVKRYNGWIAGDAESEHSADDYVAKVQTIYGYQPPLTSTADLFQ